MQSIGSTWRHTFYRVSAGGVGGAASSARGGGASSSGVWCDAALPNTLYAAFPGAFAGHLLEALGGSLACSAGAACHSIAPASDAAEPPIPRRTQLRR